VTFPDAFRLASIVFASETAGCEFRKERTKNDKVTARDLAINYARRNGIEDTLGSSVNFFHLDCLSSEVRLNVDLDTVLTVIANGCYRWLADQLHGFDLSKPKAVYRKFVETSGAVEIEPGRRIVVSLDRCSHNPILREANLAKDHPQNSVAGESSTGIRVFIIPIKLSSI